MHELSVAQALLDQVDDVARQRAALRAAGVTVRVGPLSGIEPNLLSRAFEVARLRSPLTADAALTIERAVPRVRCDACGHEGEAGPTNLACRNCGSRRTHLVEGDELLLMQVALDLPPAANQAEAPHV